MKISILMEIAVNQQVLFLLLVTYTSCQFKNELYLLLHILFALKVTSQNKILAAEKEHEQKFSNGRRS